ALRTGSGVRLLHHARCLAAQAGKLYPMSIGAAVARSTLVDATLRYRASSRGRSTERRPDAKLLGATEAARPVIAAVPMDDAMEGLPRQEVHGLRKQGLAEVHGDSGMTKPGTLAQTEISNSSRRHHMSAGKPRRYWLSNQTLSS